MRTDVVFSRGTGGRVVEPLPEPDHVKIHISHSVILAFCVGNIMVSANTESRWEEEETVWSESRCLDPTTPKYTPDSRTV